MSSEKSVIYEEDKNRIVGGTLYLVATPIGNLSDLSSRAIRVLNDVDFIAAEDTRNTANLLSALQIHRPLISYFEHNKRERGEIIVNRLLAGQSCALVTDAGTPAISDPGEDLVALCAEKNIPVTSIPGPVASINALILSGLPTGRFCFEGFLSCNKSARKKHLEELKQERRTMIFHEAPHKLRNTLADFADTFGPERRISLCRELTKIHEDIFRTTVSGAIEHYNECEPCGEYVLVLEGAKEVAVPAFWSEWDIPTHVNFYVLQGKSKMEAIKKVAKERDVSKNTVYQAVLETK